MALCTSFSSTFLFFSSKTLKPFPFSPPNAPKRRSFRVVSAKSKSKSKAKTPPNPTEAQEWEDGEDTVNIAEDVTQLIGRTPMVYLNKVVDGCVARVAAKLESMEPCHTIKDRVSYGRLSAAEERRLIFPGKTTLVESTCGNIGLSLAFVAAAKGYRVISVMPASVDLEKRMLLRAYGADIVLTDPERGLKGAFQKAKDIVSCDPDAFLFDQVNNTDNTKVHFETTGPEIWKDTLESVSILVAGIGTGSTITGAGMYLKSVNKDIKVVGVEPADKSIFSVPGENTGFAQDKTNVDILDEVVKVTNFEAVEMARRLTLEEGLLVGISSGAAAAAAINVARRPENAGKLITVIFPSFGERYLSTVLFNSIYKEALSMKPKLAKLAGNSVQVLLLLGTESEDIMNLCSKWGLPNRKF